MEIKIEPSESPQRKQPLQPPPDYTSRGTRVKLWTLVAALMFVLFGMNEARKPENWRWMGFDEEGKQKKKDDEKKFIFEEAQYDPPEPDQDSNASQSAKKNGEQGSELDTEPTPANQNVPQETIEDDKVSLAQPEFWKLIYRQLELSEQRELFSLLRELRDRTLDGEVQTDNAKLVKKIDRLRKLRLTEMLNELSLIDEGLPKRAFLNRSIQEFQNQWEQQLKPALAGEPISDGQQKEAIHQLQAALDQAAYAVVKDYTSPTKATDDPAWLRTWEKIVYSTETNSADEVKLIQLMAEADFYRGKPVLMTGQLCGIEVLPTAGNPLGTSQFYSVWIRPDLTAIQPFNVYLFELPDEIKLSEDRYTAFEDLQVSLSGYFFKVRSYKDVGNNISSTPLVLAKSMEVSKVEPAEVVPVTVRNGWTPSRELLMAFFVGMPLLAIGIAFVIFRGTKSRRLATGATMATKINHSLEELTEDPRVETVEEKLVRMEQEGRS